MCDIVIFKGEKTEKIGLLIDSTSITRDDLLKHKFIKVAQLKVNVDGTDYSESQLTIEEMANFLGSHRKMITSQPSPADFLNLYKEFFDEGYTHVITIVLSHKLSGTYQSGLIAKSMIDFNLEVSVHSPLTASFGVALGVAKIAKIIETGTTYDELIKRYHSIFQEPNVAFTLSDLKHLFKGGRLTGVQALIGAILRIKPIVEMIDGKLELVKKERTNIACLEFFINIIDGYTKKFKKVYLDIIDLNMEEWGNKLKVEVEKKYPKVEISTTKYVSPVFFVHLGNKGFGIAVLAE
jgi:DegV family protein with EDD domain